MYKYLRKYIDIFLKNNRQCVFLMNIILCCAVNAQHNAHIDYIERFKEVALSHQKKYGIPASITLAQGLLESDAGRSRLAMEANNHFGIKCGGDWKGKTIKHKAERGNECFRKYNSAEESYHDHSLFLKRKRYEPLFKYKVSDYKSWAETLHKCGYATDPKYPDKLISLIERYELHKLTSKSSKEEHVNKHESIPILEIEDDNFKGTMLVHAVHRKGNLFFILAHEGDTYELIAQEFDIKKKNLLSYNDIKQEQPLSPGDIVYLKEKGEKYIGDKQWYVVSEGETLHSISQKLGIRMKNLRKMNRKDKDFVVQLGDTLIIK